MSSTIITLTTDWGYCDFFSGKVKGKLYSYIPDVQVVDVTHGLVNHDLLRASFIVKHGCLGFPPGTIHIIDVNSNQNSGHAFVVVEYQQQYFICTDNGLPWMVFGDRFSRAVQIAGINMESDFYTFVASDLFCKVAAELAKGADLYSLGTPTTQLVRQQPLSTNIYDDHIQVYITYIDNYGNADLNITYDEFVQLCAGRGFSMNVNGVTLNKIQHGYTESSHRNIISSELMLTVSSSGHLQIALPQASAERLIGLRVLSNYSIYFK